MRRSHHDPPHGEVLVLCERTEDGDRLARLIADRGERPRVLTAADHDLLDEADGEATDLLVVDVDEREPGGRSLIRRLILGELLPDLPKLYLLRDDDTRRELIEGHPSLRSMTLPAPPPDVPFQTRVELAAEIGRLRRERIRTGVRDPLTGLFGRAYLLQRLEEEFARAKRHRTPLSFVLFGIDQLREINARFGPKLGDSAVRLVRDVLRGRVRKEDVLGRVGEECFAVMLPNNRFRGAAVFASNVRAEIAERLLPYAEGEFQVRVSAGVSSYPDNGAILTPEQLIAAAENALAQAVRRGGNRVFIDEAVLHADRRMVLIVDEDEGLVESVADLLTLDDYRVVRCPDPSAALQTLRFRRPDLLVIDLQLEDAGASFVRRIHEIYPTDAFPVVGLASEPAPEAEEMGRLGVDRFITKPFSLSLLRSIVRELLDSYTPVAR